MPIHLRQQVRRKFVEHSDWGQRMRHYFNSLFFCLTAVSILTLAGCTATAVGSMPTAQASQQPTMAIINPSATGIQPTEGSGSLLITPIPITVEIATITPIPITVEIASITPFQQVNTPDRVSTAVAGTRVAFEESTSIAATLTALAPQPTDTPLEIPTIPIATVPPPPSLNYASLINQHTQKCLTIQGNSVVQSSCVQSANQLWQIQTGSGPFKLVSKSGACLSFSDVDIVASTCNGSTAWTVRRWGDYNTIENVRKAAGKSPHGGPNHPRPSILEYGIYFQIVDGGNCVDVDGWNHDEGGRIIYWPCNGTIGDNANQLWAFFAG